MANFFGDIRQCAQQKLRQMLSLQLHSSQLHSRQKHSRKINPRKINSAQSSAAVMLLLLGAFCSSNAFAHSGHDETPVKPLLSAVANQSMARASVHSEQFELVLVWQEKDQHADGEEADAAKSVAAKNQAGELQIYLDDYASNQPIKGATIEVSGDNITGTAKERSAGVYSMPLQLGERVALTFVVQVGEQVDLLVTDLTLPKPLVASKHNHGYLDDFPAYWPGWLTFVIAASLVLIVVLWRRQQIATWFKGAQQ